MSVTAKCHNYTGCLLAYRGEEIQLAAGAPLVCPECGKPVTPAQGGAGRLMKWIVLAVVLLALASGVGAALLWAKKNILDKPKTPAATTPVFFTPVPSPTPIKSSTPNIGPSPISKAPTPVVPVVNDPPKVVQKVDTSLVNDENKRVREDVLKRIDDMPHVSATNKDKLYNSVQRARGMGMVLQIPFASGKVDLSASEIAALKTALEDPKIMRIRDDPTAVFVVLGYADSKGDNQKNLNVSQRRADAVVVAIREKAGVANVTHAVAMGGSTLHSMESLDKNRVVEVWAVLP